MHSSFNGFTLLVFGLLPVRPASSLPPSAARDEVTEYFVQAEPIKLCFPTHTDAMARYFAELERGSVGQASA